MITVPKKLKGSDLVFCLVGKRLVCLPLWQRKQERGKCCRQRGVAGGPALPATPALHAPQRCMRTNNVPNTDISQPLISQPEISPL